MLQASCDGHGCVSGGGGHDSSTLVPVWGAGDQQTGAGPGHHAGTYGLLDNKNLRPKQNPG